MNQLKRTQMVYDFPLRVFHALVATLFGAAFFIAKVIDSESKVYTLHMIAGLLLLGLVGFRLFWAVFGTTYSRFSSLELSPQKLLNYFISIINPKSKRFIGHNPASSYFALGVFIWIIALGVTGILMTSEQQWISSHDIEEVHEFFANSFILLIIAHLLGLFVHMLKHRDFIALSMLDGKKELDRECIQNEYQEVKQSKLQIFIGLGVIVGVLMGGVYLVRKAPEVHFLGIPLILSTELSSEGERD